jgi:hypothetical protein
MLCEVIQLLTLQDENDNVFKATHTREPHLLSSSKWYSSVKYINNETITFHYVKGNGSNFYFKYRCSWYRIIKYSIKTEEAPTRFKIIY